MSQLTVQVKWRKKKHTHKQVSKRRPEKRNCMGQKKKFTIFSQVKLMNIQIKHFAYEHLHHTASVFPLWKLLIISELIWFHFFLSLSFRFYFYFKWHCMFCALHIWRLCWLILDWNICKFHVTTKLFVRLMVIMHTKCAACADANRATYHKSSFFYSASFCIIHKIYSFCISLDNGAPDIENIS